MTVKILNAKDAREKLGVKQDKLGEVFREADDGKGGLDFGQVKCLGTEVKGSVAVAEQVKALTAECEELAEHAETLEAAEHAQKSYEARQKAMRKFPLPGMTGVGEKGEDGSFQIKSLGALIEENKDYLDWASKGATGTIDLSINELWGSDMLALAGMGVPTIGQKALMMTTAGFAPENVRLPGFVEAVTRPVELLDIIPTSRTGGNAVPYMEETTRAHGAAEIAEGAAYGEAVFVFTEKSSPVRKVGDSLPVTDEQLEDVALMGSYINSRLTFGVRQRVDSQVLIGDGNTPNLRGIKNTAGIQAQAKGADPVPDAFFRAMAKIRTTGGAVPTHHIIHPTDWSGIRLLKTNDGIYIFGSPSEAGPDRLWGLPVVQCSADAAGTGYVGSFQPQWISLVERRGVDVQIGYVNAQFKEGKRTIRADLRAALLIARPAAFCQVTGL